MKLYFQNLFFVFIALTACNGEKQYVLNQQENLIYKNLLLEYVKTELVVGNIDNGYAKEITGDIVKIDAVNFQTEYEKNEVAADLKFLKKTILIEGVVGSIDRGIGESYYIKFHGNQNSFMSPHASMADGYVNFLASLKKGEKITLICIGDGLLIGTPRLKQCMRFDDFALHKVNQYPSAVISTKNSDKNKVKIFAMTLAYFTTKSSVCWSTTEPTAQCISEIHTHFEQAKNSLEKHNEFKKVLGQMIQKVEIQTGIDLTDMAEK